MRYLITLKPINYLSSHNNYGVLAEIDWENGELVRWLKVPAPCYQDQHAFSVSSLSGVCLQNRKIYVAAWNYIFIVDYDTFQILDAFSMPLMCDLHGIATDGKVLWVTSTGIEAMLCIDLSTQKLKWRWGPDEKILQTAHRPLKRTRNFVERDYRYVHKSKTGYHHHHLNGVIHHQGDLYLTTKGWNDAANSAVIKLNPNTRAAEFFVKPGGFKGMHDGIFIHDRFYVTESHSNSIAWREKDGSIISKVVEPANFFVRGMCHTDQSFLVGFSTHRNTGLPACIVEYDLDFDHAIRKFEMGTFYPPEHGTGIHYIVKAPESG